MRALNFASAGRSMVSREKMLYVIRCYFSIEAFLPLFYTVSYDSLFHISNDRHIMLYFIILQIYVQHNTEFNYLLEELTIRQ